MSSRALRKLTERSTGANLGDLCAEYSEEDIPGKNLVSKFNLLQVNTNEIAISDSDSENQPSTKIHRSKGHKKQKKKSNAKQKRDIGPTDTSLFDYETVVDKREGNPQHSQSISELLVVNTKHLDPFQELSRLFGSHVVGASTSGVGIDRRAHLKRGTLVRIKPSWPPVVRFGLDMIRLENGNFTFTHSKEYYNTQKSFYVALDSMDPNNIMQILTSCPYHIDSLLQLSEVMMHQDNSDVGMDLLERALHAYQSAFHTSFNPAIGIFQLDYKMQENRGLFVALFRYINAIGTRGCYRNALDYSKILLSLDIEGDPLAVLLLIDNYALLAHQLEFLLQLYERLNPTRNLDLLPNFAFSVPLALHLASQSNAKESGDRCQEADAKLQDALIMFPGFVTRLLKHTTLGGANNLDKSVLFGKEVHTEPSSLGRLLDLYVARTHPLWISPDVLAWLERNIEIVLGLVEPKNSGTHSVPDARLEEYSKKRQTLYPALPRNVIRHLILSDLPEAPPLFPRGAQSTHIYHFDPLPPHDSINYCDPEEERLRSRPANGGSGGFLFSLFTSLLPDDSLQQAMQQFVSPAADDETGSATGQTLGVAAERLAVSLRRVLDHIDPRRVWNAEAEQTASTAENANENHQPHE